MNIKDVETVKKPIIYISLSLILSSICYGLYDNYLWLAVSTASLFFIYLLRETNISFSILILIFFILGVFININYYNVNLSEDFMSKIRLVQEKSYYKIVEVKGRKVYLEGEGLNLSLGEEGYIKGDFQEKIDKEKGIVGTVTIKEGVRLDDTLISKLYGVRTEIYLKLEENLGKRKGGLVASLAFGYSDYLDTEDKEELKTLGVIHAVSVSGLHVALIFSILRKFLGKRATLGALCIYVLFTGAPFSSIRALIMIFALNLAPEAKKKYNPLGALALSAALITVIKPYAPFQVGFMLSFLATLGIVLFSKNMDKKLYRLPKFIRRTIVVSISAQVFTAPIIMACFKECSLNFILGNILIIPILNILIVLGNFMLLALPISFIFDFFSYIILKVIKILDRCTEFLSNIEIGSYIVNESMVIIYCSILISIYFVIKGKRKLGILPVVAIFVVGVYIYSPLPRVDYLKKGALLISYRGDRKIISNTSIVEMADLKKVTLAKEGFREAKKIKIDGGTKIEAKGKNYILKLEDKEYLLTVNKKEKLQENYDIINFVDGDNKGFFILGDELLLY